MTPIFLRESKLFPVKAGGLQSRVTENRNTRVFYKNSYGTSMINLTSRHPETSGLPKMEPRWHLLLLYDFSNEDTIDWEFSLLTYRINTFLGGDVLFGKAQSSGGWPYIVLVTSALLLVYYQFIIIFETWSSMNNSRTLIWRTWPLNQHFPKLRVSSGLQVLVATLWLTRSFASKGLWKVKTTWDKVFITTFT